jgi:centrosomal protein CEP76
MIHHIFQNKIGQEIMMTRGDSIKHAIRVKIVTYPENVCAIWVMFAVRYRSIH